MIFDLVRDFADVLDAMPHEHPRYRILELLDEAIRRDVHFIARHSDDYPQGLFQCLWNTGWWYDAPEAAAHYDLGKCTGKRLLSWELPPEQRLTALLERWRAEKEGRTAGFAWLRATRPPAVHLGSPQRSVLRGHEGKVTSVSFAPDGRRVVSGSSDNTVRVWDALSGAAIHVCHGHEGQVCDTRFFLDSRQILSRGADDTLRVWDAESGRECLRLGGHERKICNVAVSRDGMRIAGGVDDDSVRGWDAVTGLELFCLRGGSGTCLAFSPDGQRVVCGSYETVRVWDVASGGEVLCLHAPHGPVKDVFFSPDGQRLIARSTACARVWNAAGDELLCIQEGGILTRLTVSPNGERIVTAARWLIRVHDAATGDLLHELRHQPGPGGTQSLAARGAKNTGLIFSPDGRRFLSWMPYDDTVRVWDPEAGVEVGCLCGHESEVLDAAFSPDGRTIVTGSADRTVRLWNARSDEPFRPLLGHEAKIFSLAFSHDGVHLASGSRDDTVRVWETASGRQLFCLRGHEDEVHYLRFADARRLVSAGLTSVRIWDLTSGDEVRRLITRNPIIDESPDACAISPDNRRIASSRFQEWVVWDAATGDQLFCLSLEESLPICVAFAPDGRRVVCGAGDGVVRVWDLIPGCEPLLLRGHEGPVYSVTFSPDGGRVVSGSDDKTVRLWDARTGTSVAVLRGHEGTVERVAYSTNGRRIVSGTADKMLRVWDAGTFACLEVIPGTGDTTAIAAGARRFPWRALTRGLDTVIEDAASGQVIARFAMALDGIVTHPSSRQWAGSGGNQVFIVALDGVAPLASS